MLPTHGSNFRQPKIQNLGVPALGYKNVCRLDVAVNDPSGVSRVQCVGDLDGEREKDFHFQRTPRDAVLQGHTVQKLHGDERMTIVLADFVNRADVGMVEGGSGTSFAAETLQSLRVLGYVIQQEFQRDEAPKLGVLGLVDDAHPATAEFLDDAVVGNGLTDKLGACGHWLEC